ncbi:endonuclease 8-like 1 isoform X2 [Pomacea canaliculata]|uniref:endonuclease 8-like 1 isoform X2 n=1 Tax=Pomacea canaliculata TaxID=400727 RepID=UPI000D73CCC8|nr:endonuclease 8-like 1 isoform X2 [Pomacea canaliculata]
MPEGPELNLSSQFINFISKGRLFAGKVRKNPIHKCAEVKWNEPRYTVAAVSRGKELKVFLQTHREEKDEKKGAKSRVKNEGKRLHIVFNFGMSGHFEFTSVKELPKHAHLSFFTNTQPAMALSFVDPRRFGKWQVDTDWSPNRGPCVMSEYPQFRSNVLQNLKDSVFNRPLCEALLNQKYFNGIGNYLRAEIIYRAGVKPFEQARSVLATLSDVPEDVKAQIEDKAKNTGKMKSESPDLLQLCNLVPLEAIGLGTSLYLTKEEFGKESKFWKWLRCYCQPGMNSIPDHNKRTMWYHGDAGPLVPKETEKGGRQGN